MPQKKSHTHHTIKYSNNIIKLLNINIYIYIYLYICYGQSKKSGIGPGRSTQCPIFEGKVGRSLNCPIKFGHCRLTIENVNNENEKNEG